jgi:hypothetical protein
MSRVTFGNFSDKDGKDRMQVTAMVIAFDNYIRNLIPDNIKERIKNNIQNMLDQVYDEVIDEYGTNADRAAKNNK